MDQCLQNCIFLYSILRGFEEMDSDVQQGAKTFQNRNLHFTSKKSLNSWRSVNTGGDGKGGPKSGTLSSENIFSLCTENISESVGFPSKITSIWTLNLSGCLCDVLGIFILQQHVFSRATLAIRHVLCAGGQRPSRPVSFALSKVRHPRDSGRAPAEPPLSPRCAALTTSPHSAEVISSPSVYG